LLRNAKGNPTCVAKYVILDEDELGEFDCPFRGEKVEYAMASLLRQFLLETGRCPHICVPVYPPCDIPSDESVLSFWEYAIYGDMMNHFDSLPRNQEIRGQFFQTVFFQVTYMLVATQMTFPTFRHNDLATRNVLITDHSHEGYSEYIVEQNTFYLPNCGYIALVADFDYSAIPGLIDNAKIGGIEMNSPFLNITTRLDKGYDILTFAQYLCRTCKSHVPKNLLDAVKTMWTKEVWESCTSANHWRPRPSMTQRGLLPSAMDVLTRCTVFSNFKKAPGATQRITHRYCATPLSPVRGEIVLHDFLPTYNKIRYAPAYWPSPYAGNPMVEQWKESKSEKDKLYRGKTFKQYFNRLAKLFRKATAEADISNEIANSLICEARRICDNLQFHLGSFWWPMVAARALADAAWELDLLEKDEAFMDIDSWNTAFDGQYEKSDSIWVHFAIQWGWMRNDIISSAVEDNSEEEDEQVFFPPLLADQTKRRKKKRRRNSYGPLSCCA
jgi:hypothetical protein